MSNKTLYLYRTDSSGQRTRWAFELDDRMTILSEKPVEEQRSIPGVRTSVVNGQRQVVEIDDQTQRAYQFFIPDSPCWFDGCEALRAEYERELSDLGPGCASCQKGDLIRKYLPWVKKAMV